MPIYEYACPRCGEFEVSQRISDRPLQRCPTCRRKVTRLISSTSFQLKGSGWYATDYSSKDSGKTDTSTASSSDTAKDSTKKDSTKDTGKTGSSGESKAASAA